MSGKFNLKNEDMAIMLFILIIFVLIAIAVIIFVFKKNYSDRKNLFNKMPGDYPDPENVESEFDSEDIKNSKYEANKVTD